ncbi:hypothetical protein TNCV_3333391 [Trichonephila clavipes]|nr:hypothetical protein TNCV_3333391 [Trichonephila clavipes]
MEPYSQRELSPTTVKTGIDRRTRDQLTFPNSLVSAITRSHALRLLVMGFLKNNIYRECLTTMLGFKNSILRQKLHIMAIFNFFFNSETSSASSEMSVPKYFSVQTSKTASRAL